MKKLELRKIIREIIKEQEETPTAIANAINPECAQEDLWAFSNLYVPGQPVGEGNYFDINTMNTVCTALCITGTNMGDFSEEQIEHTCGCCEDEFNIILPATADQPIPINIIGDEPDTGQLPSTIEDQWWENLDSKEKTAIMKRSRRIRR